MLRKTISLMLTVSLLISMVGLLSGVQISALEVKPTYEDKESEPLVETKANLDYIVPVGSGYDITYYDQDNNEVDVTVGDSVASVDEMSFPSSYDLRDESRGTPVRDQGSEGLCWDFATTASIESSILSNPELRAALGENPQETLDLSEAGNAWYIHTNIEDEDSYLYGDYIYDENRGDEGGYHTTIVQGLSSGFGAYPEDLMIYSDWEKGFSEALRFYSDYRLKDFIDFSYDINLMKERVMNYGALYLSYPQNYNSNFNMTEDGMQAFYSNGTPINPDESDAQGHAVAVVGWDDNFSRENFCEEMRPENDGAWLIKNSWGTDSGSTAEGYEGYFWMSYESVVSDVAQYVVQSVDEFDNIYQHQYTYDFYLNVKSAANVFMAENDEILEQICFSNFYPVNATFEIYKLNKNYTTPVDGELILSFEEYVNYSGTHCIEVPETVELLSGDIFSIVIKSENELDIGQRVINENPIQLEKASYYFDDQWQDVTTDDFDFTSYMCIKAYTSNKDGAVYKNELSDLVSYAENFEINEDLYQEIKDNITAELENAKKVLNDNTASQNTVDNTYCLLKKAVDEYTDLIVEINSMEDYIRFYNATINKKYVDSIINLNTDLDFSGLDEFKPLFNNGCFEGVFNGNGHTISNLKVNSSDEGACGLFYELNGATVSNLNLENCSFNAYRRAGAICAVTNNSAIFDITITDSEIVTNFRSAGGIASQAESTTITDCEISGTRIASKQEDACGIIGTDFDIIVENCEIYDTEIIARNCAAIFSDGTEDNCVYENVILKAWGYLGLSDNVNVYLNSDNYDCASLLVYENDKITLNPYIGEIAEVSSDEAIVTKSGDIYEIDLNGNTRADIWVTYEPFDVNYFSFSYDILTNEVELIYYYNYEDVTATEIIFPSKIGLLTVTSISSDFSIESVAPIKSIVWAEGIEMIPSFMFMSFTDLETVTIPDSVKYIGYGAFLACENIKDVYYGGTEEQWNLLRIGSVNESIKNANIHFTPDETTSVTTDPVESTPVVTEPESTVTDPVESTPVTEPESTVTDPVESTPVTDPDSTVTEPVESTTETEPESTVTEPVESTTVTEPESTTTEPAESTTATEPESTTEPTESATATEATEPTQSTTTEPKPEFEVGDVNKDGKVNIKDATLIQKHIAKLLELDSAQLVLADCNMDNKVNIKDATYIQKKIAKLI